jgi:hypothetical protein
MRKIIKSNGEVYMEVEVKDGFLKLKCLQGTAANLTYEVDAKIIPQLRQILTEAEFLKYI